MRAAVGLVAALVACSPDGDAELQVVASVADGAAARRSGAVPPPSEGCPDDKSGGVAGRVTPSVYAMNLRKLTLLGAPGTDDVDLYASEAYDEAGEVDLSSSTVLAEQDALPAGSYTGLYLEVWSIRMDFPMVLPAVDAEAAEYGMRGWFAEVGPYQRRDVTVLVDGDDEVEDGEYWVEPDGALASVEAARPGAWIDLWHDEDFWGQEPVGLSTEADFGGDFRFVADGALEVSGRPGEQHVVEMRFDLIERFTWWEDLPDGDASSADGAFTMGDDCGLRILFPDVDIDLGG